MQFQRYAIYFTPQTSALADFGAKWFGWDMANGIRLDPLATDEIIKTPQRYGFHATIKPPFRLAAGHSPQDLERALEQFCDRSFKVSLEGLKLAQLGSFIALVPLGDSHDLNALAADTVEALDVFRAPITEAELVKRRSKGLSVIQDGLLMAWGYPYVMEEFRFHMTLTGRLPKALRSEVIEALEEHLQQVPLRPFTIDALSLVGEDMQGFFHLIHRYALSN
ncbi:MAG: DUF1045 domain-containing protein [Pseudomonadota bacterium]